jgi:DNA polymerase|tara:strand:+ start:406 stop:1083 length:678 start_codon:yes stop_codon:yes gene_type:complete
MTSIPHSPEGNCKKCELWKQAKSVCISTIHYPSSLLLQKNTLVLLILGQNPGFHEDLQSIPFVGRAGKILKEAYIGGTNLQDRISIYLSNGVRCHTINNETPKPRHYIECNQYLINDINQLNPNIILTLGAPTTNSFFKNILGLPKISLKKAFGLNGNFYSQEETNLKNEGFNLFSTYHPSALIRNNNLINSVHSHMQLISDCVDGTMASPSNPKIIPIRNPHES